MTATVFTTRDRRAGEASRALFLDRDGTLVYPRHYPSRPADLCLYDGIGPLLRRLQVAGLKLVVVTNQSGLARGYFTAADLDRMHRFLAQQLRRVGVRLDGIYHCPHHPEGIVPELAVRCSCRKPEPGMMARAAADLGLDLNRSWLIGDILDDVEAGNRAGCRTILIDLGTERAPEQVMRRPTFVARNTCHALRIVGALEGIDGDVQLGYEPPSWVRQFAARRAT